MSCGEAGGDIFDLHRYDKSTGAFTFVDGTTNRGAAAVISGKPTPRYAHAGWSDSAGNFWLYGGWSWPETGTSTGIGSDTWVYNVSSTAANKWRFVTGSKIPYERLTGQLEPRLSVGSWKDAGDGWFYIYGGTGRTTTAGANGYCMSITFFFFINFKKTKLTLLFL